MTTIIKKDIPKRNSNQSYNGGGNTTIIQGTPTPVIDNLNSKSSTSALSANQGRVINNIKLSKETDDTCKGYITFNKGLMSYGDIKAGGFNDNGDTGKGAALFQNNGKWNIISDKNVVRNSISTSDYDDINNKGAALYQNEAKTEWNAVVDNLRVRGKFNVTTLEVEHAKHIGGDIYLTKAGMVCNKVEKINSGTLTNPMVRYKCYFDNVGKDGLKIYNQFEAGDLAFCQTFNNNQVRKWWRAVHGVGENWILVDDIGCLEGSDIPQAGDHIVQLGNMTSVEATKDRQTAVILSTDSICLYRGINDFVLPEPYIRLDPRNTKIDAASIEFLGQVVANGNFVVDTLGNLTVKGHIVAYSGEFTGTIKANTGNIGLFTINERGLYNDIQQGKAEIEIVNSADAYEKIAIGTEDNVASLDISNRGGNCINLDTESGTALKCVSHTGHGLEANNVLIKGLNLNTLVFFDNTHDTDLNLTNNVDYVKFAKSLDKPKTLVLPNFDESKGKIIYIKNVSQLEGKHKHILLGFSSDGADVYLEDTSGNKWLISTPDNAYILQANTTYTFLNDGSCWSMISFV